MIELAKLGELEKMARDIAEYANTCCDRIDGYEEDVYARTFAALKAAYILGMQDPND